MSSRPVFPVGPKGGFHILTVGWGRPVIDKLWNRIDSKSEAEFSHIAHPKHIPGDWGKPPLPKNVHFFRRERPLTLPAANRRLLASLEQDGIPTVHNMILGDRVVSKLPYEDALRYATFLAIRLKELFEELAPSVIIGGFDAIHSGIGCAVAKKAGIPWLALNFSVIPPGMACFCGGMTPGSRVFSKLSNDDLLSLAERSLVEFESREIQAPAYIAPEPQPFAEVISGLPRRLSAAVRLIRRARQRQDLRFTELSSGHDVRAAIGLRWRSRTARRALSAQSTVTTPPSTSYAFFGLHMQPESSIDVWAPFFSNQMWVIELLARSIPPTHKLLVKIHKSDVSHYSGEELARMQSLPGVELVAPFADTRCFIQDAELVIAIQGTIGLEAALLGKPVIMLGDSPVTVFPSVSAMGQVGGFPDLIRSKLGEKRPTREAILSAYASFLSPFSPASLNNWFTGIGDQVIDNYVRLFSRLRGEIGHLATFPDDKNPKIVEGHD